MGGGTQLGTEQVFCDLAAITCRQLCISQDWTGTVLNRSIQGLIDHVGIGNVSTEHLLEQLNATLQLSQSVATAWSGGATLDCVITLLQQQDQALRRVSPLVSQDEREHLRSAPFVASSLLDNLPTKLELRDKVISGQRDYALYRCSAPFAVSKYVLPHIDQRRLHPCHDGMLLCRCRPHVHIPFWSVGNIVQDVTFANEEDDYTGCDYLCPRTLVAVSPTVARPLTLAL